MCEECPSTGNASSTGNEGTTAAGPPSPDCESSPSADERSATADNGEPTVLEDLRERSWGWLPWILAVVYFPLYVLLDTFVGGLLTVRLGLPRSVSVGLVSLSISVLVTSVVIVVRLEGISTPEPGDVVASVVRVRSRVTSVVVSVGRWTRRTLDEIAGTESADSSRGPRATRDEGSTGEADEMGETGETDDESAQAWPGEWRSSDEL